jgi:surface carbohydrate biosynthesis protein
MIPVENAVRELDAKLLLAAVAAERGFPVVIGSRQFLHYEVPNIPRGVYLAKSMRKLSRVMFRILREVGHDIIGFDEEALVHPPAEHYYARRLDRFAVRRVSHVLCWGEDNAELFRGYKPMKRKPLHITGNSRTDFLRPELREYLGADAQRLRDQYGDFVLIASSFAAVRPFADSNNDDAHGEYWTGRARHRAELLEHFEQMLPVLADALPGVNLVVRPHPSESLARWEELASRHPCIHVSGRGSVLGWALAAKATIHNGSSAGLEAAVLGVPVIQYQPVVAEVYEAELPAQVSQKADSLAELVELTQRIMAGESGDRVPAPNDALKPYLAGLDGPLASDRIVDVIEAAGYLKGPQRMRNPLAILKGRVNSAGRKRIKARDYDTDGHRRSAAYHRHRFPPIAASELQMRIARMGSALGRFEKVFVREYAENLFEVRSSSPAGPRSSGGG